MEWYRFRGVRMYSREFGWSTEKEWKMSKEEPTVAEELMGDITNCHEGTEVSLRFRYTTKEKAYMLLMQYNKDGLSYRREYVRETHNG
jgi:hypothetical protein